MKIGSKRRNKLSRTSSRKPTIRIGKNGLAELVIEEIDRYLDVKKSVKVRVLKSALASQETDEIARKAAEATGSMLAEVRGHTFTLYKPRKLTRKS